MPEAATSQRAKRKVRRGGSPSSAAGELVREEIHHIRKGKHGARSTKQAIAIGLAKARRAGVKMPVPKRGTVSKRTRDAAERDAAAGRKRHHAPSRTRSRAAVRALKREPREAASHRALSKHAPRASARKAARTRARKAATRRQAARKAAASRRRSK